MLLVDLEINSFSKKKKKKLIFYFKKKNNNIFNLALTILNGPAFSIDAAVTFDILANGGGFFFDTDVDFTSADSVINWHGNYSTLGNSGKS